MSADALRCGVAACQVDQPNPRDRGEMGRNTDRIMYSRPHYPQGSFTAESNHTYDMNVDRIRAARDQGES